MSMGFSTSFTSEFLVSESARIVLRLRELVQILAPEERFTCLRVQNYRYWHPVNNSKYVFVYSSWHTGIFSSVPVGTEELSTKSYGCTSFMTRAFLVPTHGVHSFWNLYRLTSVCGKRVFWGIYFFIYLTICYFSFCTGTTRAGQTHFSSFVRRTTRFPQSFCPVHRSSSSVCAYLQQNKKSREWYISVFYIYIQESSARKCMLAIYSTIFQRVTYHTWAYICNIFYPYNWIEEF